MPLEEKPANPVPTTALRHADIGMTNEFYTDSRRPATLGLGYLLVTLSEKIIDLQENPLREHISQLSQRRRLRLIRFN
jgi:hypothetical protein